MTQTRSLSSFSRHWTAIACASLLMALAFGSQTAQAQVDWSNTTGAPFNPYYDIHQNWVGGLAPTASQTARFNQDAAYEVWWDEGTSENTPAVGFLQILDGQATFLNEDAQAQYEYTINGSGGTGSFSDFSISGATTTLTNRGLHLRSLGGAQLTGGATMTLDGSHSQGAQFTVDGPIGFQVDGNLNVEAGGVVSNTRGFMGVDPGSTGTATVNGAGSQWNNSVLLHVGSNGSGTLNVEAGGVVSNGVGFLGTSSGSTGTATVNGAGSQWNNSGQLFVGDAGIGTLNVEAGGVVGNTTGRIGFNSGSTGTATVNGAGSQWNNSGELIVGDNGTGTLNVQAGGVVSSPFGRIGANSGSTGTATVTGAGSQWNSGNLFMVGNNGNGTLNVEAGGMVSNSFGFIGSPSGSTGTATVTGAGSQWNNSSDLFVGRSGTGTLSVEAGGVVSNRFGNIGLDPGSTGTATVTGAGSQWNNSSDLFVGRNGTGTLNVEAEGVVNNRTGFIGRTASSTGTATVTGAGSQWNNSGDLQIAPAGTGTLNIADNGLVSVGGTTTIRTNGSVNLTGGRFEFGQTTLGEFATINAASGAMAGNIDHTGYTNVATLTPFQNTNVDLTEVTFSNSGTLYGDSSLGIALVNNADGEVQTVNGERMRFAGSGNTNAGEVNNFGGQIRFEGDFTNQSGGFVSGRGQYFANGGWTNDGVMAFNGTTDILGDINNQSGGQIVTSGGATTTIFDDLIHNGTEIRTSAGSNTVIFGSATGAGAFTGTGTVFFEGDLRPGNSPASVLFEGDVVLGLGANSFFELGGLGLGEFDQVLVAGDLSLDGSLQVSLLDGFQLTFNDEFLIGDIGGNLFGQFSGLSEGGLVGNFGGMDLFISYAAGNGNDISLFTAVPEPSSMCLLGLLGMGLMLNSRNRRHKVRCSKGK